MSVKLERKELVQDQNSRMNENQNNNRLDGFTPEIQRTMQVRQVRLLKALTPSLYLLDTNAEIFDPPIFPTRSTISDVQAEPPEIFERIESNSRYKDIPELIGLFEKHGSHGDNYGTENYLSDGCTLLSNLQIFTLPAMLEA